MARSYIKTSRGRVETDIARVLLPKLGMVGNIIFVDYQHGHDNSGCGNNFSNPLKTITAAYNKTKDANNDVVVVLGSATDVADTSQYLSTELVWANNNTHLVGLGTAQVFNGRCRIAHISTFTAAAGTLFKLSGQGCLIEGVHFYDGITFANRICLEVTGQRNRIEYVSAIGLSGALAAADAGSSNLLVNGGMENAFENMWVGSNATLRSAANANIRLRNGAGRNEFKNVIARCFTSDATSLLIDANAANAMSRDNLFTGFAGINIPVNLETSAVALNVAVSVNAGSSGVIALDPTSYFVGCTKVAANTVPRTYVAGVVPTAGTSGLSVVAA